jgi:threonine/homoserine/homoserine lactone efflux protein
MTGLLPDPPILAAFVGASLLLGLAPGPDMAGVIATAARHGVLRGTITWTGAVTGTMVHVALVAFGLSTLMLAAPPVYMAVKIAGAVYLLWLAWTMVREGGGLTLPERRSARLSFGQAWRRGLAVNLMNPKAVVFFLTFFPQFVPADAPHPVATFALLGVILCAVNLPLYAGLALAGERAGRWLSEGGRAAKAVNWLTAGVFAAFAARLLATSVREG